MLHKIQLKHFFIPSKRNNYYPHILHTKRAIFYSLFFLSMKLIVFVFVVLLPLETFTMPDMLESLGEKIISQTNEVRNKLGIRSLDGEIKLFSSANNKSLDMVEKGYFGHISPDGKRLRDFLQEVDYNYRVAGENLAVGYRNVDDLIMAWKKSPKHYDNLVDKDFKDIGIGMVVGEYKGIPNMIFVTQHFGKPINNKLISEVAGFTEEKEIDSQIVYDREKSQVLWQEDLAGTVTLTARAYILGEVSKVKVQANQYNISLSPSGKEGIFVGKLQFVGNSDDLFQVITNPTISFSDNSGLITEDIISWYNPKIMPVSSIEKYNQSKSGLSKMFSIFNISRGIYLFFIGFFTFALLLKIFIEFRKQHPHVIVQTLLLISLLVVLFEI